MALTPSSSSGMSNDDENQLAVVVANLNPYKFWHEVNRTDDVQYSLAVTGFLGQPPIQAILDNLSMLEDQESPLLSVCDGNIKEGSVGYVYAAWNPLFEDMIKIGATVRRPFVRVAELAGSGVPKPFQLITSIPCTNPFKLEREIHTHFNSVRKYGRKKELFELTRSAIVKHFQSISELAEIHVDTETLGEEFDDYKTYVMPTLEQVQRARKRHLDDQERELKNEEKRVKLLERYMNKQAKGVKIVENVYGYINRIHPDGADVETRQNFSEYVKELMFGESSSTCFLFSGFIYDSRALHSYLNLCLTLFRYSVCRDTS